MVHKMLLSSGKSKIVHAYAFVGGDQTSIRQAVFICWRISSTDDNILRYNVPLFREGLDFSNPYVKNIFRELDACYVAHADADAGACERVCADAAEVTRRGSVQDIVIKPGERDYAIAFIQDADEGIFLRTLGAASQTIFSTTDIRYDSLSALTDVTKYIKKFEYLAGFSFGNDLKRFVIDGPEALITIGHRRNIYAETIHRWGMPNYFVQVAESIFLIYTTRPRVHVTDSGPRYDYGEASFYKAKTADGQTRIIWKKSNTPICAFREDEALYAVLDFRHGVTISVRRFGDADYSVL